MFSKSKYLYFFNNIIAYTANAHMCSLDRRLIEIKTGQCFIILEKRQVFTTWKTTNIKGI